MHLDSFLDTKGIEKSDISSILFIHTALSALWVASTWSAIYMLAGKMSNHSTYSAGMPSTNSFLLNTILKVDPVNRSKSIPLSSRLCLKISHMEEMAKESRLVNFVQRKLPWMDANRLTFSFVEAKICRLFLKPVTVPGRIWLSIRGAASWRQLKEHRDSNDEKLNLDYVAFFEERRKNLTQFQSKSQLSCANNWDMIPKKYIQKQQSFKPSFWFPPKCRFDC